METIRYKNIDVILLKETKYTYKIKLIDGTRKTIFKNDKDVDNKSFDDFLDEHIY